MSAARPLVFLSGDVFDLLVRAAPNEILNRVETSDFETAIGTSQDRFRFIVDALRAENRTQGFVGQETAGYLCKALALSLLELDTEFETRTSFSKDEALAVLQALTQQTTSAEVA